MKESELTQDLMKDLHSHHQEWQLIKHCDRFTAGIPDLSISDQLYHTAWVEVKEFAKTRQVLSLPSTWADSLLQVETLVRVAGIYYVYDPFSNHAALVYPAEVKKVIRTDETLILSQSFMMWPGKSFDKLENYVEQIFKGAAHVDIRSL